MCQGWWDEGTRVDFESPAQVGRTREVRQGWLAGRSSGSHHGGGPGRVRRATPRTSPHTQCYALPMDHLPLGSARN